MYTRMTVIAIAAGMTLTGGSDLVNNPKLLSPSVRWGLLLAGILLLLIGITM